MRGFKAVDSALEAATDERRSEASDWDLLARAAAGDLDAFAPLVERHETRLVHVCARLLGDIEEGRDAAQEVFLRVYRKAGTFEPRGQVFTLLYRIAVNYCLNRLRRRRIVRFVSLRTGTTGDDGPAVGGGREESAPEPADGRAGAERRLQAKEEWATVQRAMAALPSGQRVVLVLAKFEGLSYREIATTLGITEGAVESRLVRAMRTLSRSRSTPAEVQAARAQEPALRRVAEKEQR